MIHRIASLSAAGVTGVALCLSAGALASSGVQAGPIPGPLCGPTYQWSCSAVGGPEVLFVGTVCDKRIYESKTGQICVPLGG